MNLKSFKIDRAHVDFYDIFGIMVYSIFHLKLYYKYLF